MAISLGWFGIRDVSAKAAESALRATMAMAKREEIPEYFRIFEPPSTARTLAFWRPKRSPWTVVVLGGTGSQYQVPAHSAPMWAQAVSQQMRAVAISFVLLEGGWSYAVFDGGSEIVAQESYALPKPQVYGDRARGALVLRCEPTLFDRYEAALVEERPVPLAGDQYAPTDEWSHLDFARHLGLVYPDEKSGTIFSPSRSEREQSGSEWRGLPTRLAMPNSPPHPQAKGQEIDFDNFPSGDDPF
jgi:hypothetical protein